MTEDQTSRIERKIETLATAVNEHRVSTARELGELSSKVDGIASRIGRVEDSTGQVDVRRQRLSDRPEKRPSILGMPTGALKILAYIALALIGVGICLGSRGDADALDRLIDVTTQMGRRLERIEATGDQTALDSRSATPVTSRAAPRPLYPPIYASDQGGTGTLSGRLDADTDE